MNTMANIIGFLVLLALAWFILLCIVIGSLALTHLAFGWPS